MKKYAAFFLVLLAAASIAQARNWKPVMIIGISEDNVSGKLIREKHTMHYTVETEDMVLQVDYAFHPSSGKHGSAPALPVNAVTKISVEGRHVYILDANNDEVKMHIVRKTMK
jgi:hypothetical protein